MQNRFFGSMMNGVGKEQLDAFFTTIDTMSRNLDKILEGEF